jgi:hypothetical protein
VESLHFWEIAARSPFVYLQSPSLCFLSARPCRPRRPCAELQLPPRRLSSRHVLLLHPARRFPARAGLSLLLHVVPPSPEPPCVPPATAPTHPCLLLDLKHVLELPMNSLLPSRACISTAFLSPELHASPEPRRCLGSPSTAPAAASHLRSSTLAAPPQPTDAHRPNQFHSPHPHSPDHYAGELELPLPLGLAIVPMIHRLSAPDKYPISTTSS